MSKDHHAVPNADGSPIVQLEPIAHPGCPICTAADRHRWEARRDGRTMAVADANRIIHDHPHRSAA
ncbi:hypothetical protein [Streptomyces chrestomyceticus]|uniref:hypothetical protein n=1 Tax=Streptomyces chrestomyceticus TaxID=68185 RepID=UPI0033EC02CA